MEILIIGGNGGIGLAMVQEAAARFPQAHVHATCLLYTSDAADDQ